MSALVLAVVLSLGALLALRRLPPLHPAQLWILPWSVASMLYALRLLPYRPLSASALFLILGGSVAFMTAAWAAGRPAGRRLPAGQKTSAEISRAEYPVVSRAAALLLPLAAVWLGAFMVQVSLRFGLKAAFVSSADVRLGLGAGALSLTIKYVYASFAAALVCGFAGALAGSPRARIHWLLAAAACVLSTYFTTGRSNLVTAALLAGLPFAVVHRDALTLPRLLGATAATAVLVLGALLIGGGIIGKTFSNSELATIQTPFTGHSWSEQLALPYEYATAPIAAFNELDAIAPTWGRTAGCATLSAGCSVLSALGLPAHAEPPIRAFTGPPLPWNTYTALDSLLIDGGPALVIPFAAILGLITGRAWRVAVTLTPLGIIFYSMLATATLFSSVQNNFFASHLLGAMVLAAAAVFVAGRSVSHHFRFSAC